MCARILLPVAAALVAIGDWAAPAAAGAGCHGEVTQGKGDTVELVDACFTPAILHVQPGTSVSFVNRDQMLHNVGGGGWGHYDDMDEGDAFTATFDDEGTYPFACSYHPGMTGAIVVGDGDGPGNGFAVDVEPLVLAPEEPAASASGGGAGWIAAGVIGLLVGGGIGVALRGSRRKAS
jgi:plastocyanin